MINQNLITNEDYQDFRELICYERPASILLHFNHNLLGLRLFFADRILLHSDGDRIVTQSNKFAEFLNEYNVLANINLSTKSVDEFENELRQQFETRSAHAVLLTYGNHLAGELLLSTWMIEYRADEMNPWLVTSLRGDDFYVRRAMTTEEVYNKSFKNNNITEAQSLSFSDEILSLGRLSLNDFAKEFKIDETLFEVSQKLSKKRLLGEPAGCEILLNKAIELRPQHIDLVNKVAGGFKNILLVKYFWPLQFHFKPFLVFANHYLKVKNISDEFMALEISSIKTETEILNGLATKYGINPQSKTLEQFYQYFISILQRAQAIENHFFANYPEKKISYKVVEIGLFSTVLFPTLEQNSVHITSRSTAAPILHLSDKSAMADPTSGYLDKWTVRKRLSETPFFSVDHKIISSRSDLTQLKYPLVLKSSLGWGSGYVFIVNNASEGHRCVAQIRNLHRLVYAENTDAKILAEEILEGQEFAAEVKMTSQGPKVLSIFERLEKERNEILDHAYVLIPSHQKVLRLRFSHILCQICKDLEVTSPFVHIEFKWNEKQNRFGLIEVNFRLGGGGFLAGVAQLACSLNIFKEESIAESDYKDSADDIFLGLIPAIKGRGLIKEIKGQEQIMKMKSTKKAFWLKSKGSYFSPPPLGFDYPAAIISAHKDIRDMTQYISEVEQVLEFIYE